MSGAPDDRAELEAARRILASDDPEPSAADLRRVWSRIAEPKPPAWHRSSIWLAPIALLAGVLLFWIQPQPDPPPADRLVAGAATSNQRPVEVGAALPHASPLSIASRSRLRYGPAWIVAGASSVLTLAPEPRAHRLLLEAGYLALRVEPLRPGERLVIETREARIAVVGTELRVRAGEDGTAIEVEEGVVEVTPRRDPIPRALRAGQRTFVPRDAPAAASSVALAKAPVHAVVEAPQAPSALRRAAPKEHPPAPGTAAPPPPPPSPSQATAPKVDPDAAPAPAPGQARVPAAADKPIEEPSSAPGDPRSKVRAAREALAVDAAKARAIAEEVLREAPAPEVEIEALMIRADAARRGDDLPAALETYRRVADHPGAARFREEALLRAARIHVALGDPEFALQLLERAGELHPRGALEPERHALAARIERDRGRFPAAAAWLEAVPEGHRSLLLAREQLAVARALGPTDTHRAQKLVQGLEDPRWPPEIRAAARQIRGEIKQ
jgi:ferric-dicitrate binding protein FerR (iron transport regulator)